MFTSKSAKTAGYSPSADQIAGDEDLLTEILLLLPPKSLLRFQSVSKQWLSLISNPQFRRHHSRRNPNSLTTALFLFRSLYTYRSQFNFVFLEDQENQTNPIFSYHFLNFVDWVSEIRSFHSCNGLFCVYVSTNWHRGYFYIYNPTTNQSIKLPLSDRPEIAHIEALNLAFDPSKSPHYKVVCVWESIGSTYQFSTYTSETGLWRDSGESLISEPLDDNDNCRHFFGKGVFWNGAIHWVSKSDPFVCFDVDRECFKPMPTTPIPEGRLKRKIKYFGESGGHLYLIEDNGPRKKLLDVLEMEIDYSKWFVKYHVDLDAMFVAFPHMVPSVLDPYTMTFHDFNILCLLQEEKEEKSRLLLSIRGKSSPKVFSYDLSDMTVRELPVTIPRHFHLNVKGLWRCKWYYAYQYSETLACV
uniref:F-box domain-containing protein n=1 Tax=Davidia involucrata TaxID=16924 RepID=A0A5B7BI65_DAVIN